MAVKGPGTLVGSGRTADVYDVGNGRVLRRYRDGRDARAVAGEAQVMAHARASDVPVPEVFDVSGCDIVMEHAVGPTMLDVIGRRPWTVRAQARTLAGLHRDLHPQNVILTRRGPVIIDWDGASYGPAIADIALTWAIVGYSTAPGARLRATAALGVQAAFTRSFVRAAGPIDEAWRQVAIRHRLADPNVLPEEAVRLKRAAAALRTTGRPLWRRRP